MKYWIMCKIKRLIYAVITPLKVITVLALYMFGVFVLELIEIWLFAQGKEYLPAMVSGIYTLLFLWRTLLVLKVLPLRQVADQLQLLAIQPIFFYIILAIYISFGLTLNQYTYMCIMVIFVHWYCATQLGYLLNTLPYWFEHQERLSLSTKSKASWVFWGMSAETLLSVLAMILFGLGPQLMHPSFSPVTRATIFTCFVLVSTTCLILCALLVFAEFYNSCAAPLISSKKLEQVGIGPKLSFIIQMTSRAQSITLYVSRLLLYAFFICMNIEYVHFVWGNIHFITPIIDILLLTLPNCDFSTPPTYMELIDYFNK